MDIDKLDYSLYLPLFFDGLAEPKHPYKTYARQGVSDLLHAGGDKIHPVVPQLILPLKSEYLSAMGRNRFGTQSVPPTQVRIQFAFWLKFFRRRIEHQKRGGNVHDTENHTTAGDGLGYGGTRPSAILPPTFAYVQCL